MVVLHIGFLSHYTDGMIYQDNSLAEMNVSAGHDVVYITDTYKYENGKYVLKDTYFPKMNTLIINSLCVVIEDKDLQTRRNAMDFLIKIFPINCDNSLLLDIKIFIKTFWYIIYFIFT